MARKRLTPTPAPTPPQTRPDAAQGVSRVPIAQIAADAVGAAGIAELAEEMSRARADGRMVLDLPLDDIAPDHLTRDRLPIEDEEMTALRESLRAHGQRTPIEVTPVEGPLPYGLISGWRRLTALKALFAETGAARFATIQALVRTPRSASAAYVAMVEENEIRVGLSQYERARVAARATQRGVFASEKEALLTLFATASRAKRSRIRAFLEIYHTLDGVLRFPAHLPERLGLSLVEALRAGQVDRDAVAAALAEADPAGPEAELDVLTRLIAARTRHAPKPAPAPRQRLRQNVSYEDRLRGHTLTIRLTGKGVDEALRAELRALLMAHGRDGG